jgi:hypothetical protein
MKRAFAEVSLFVVWSAFWILLAISVFGRQP